ncbi:Metallo-beta-lactamase superfamily protein [Syntrophus gentianae]|uniref:Metallo-beta-lactamase superfamily protein n=1 Tax=Syntrophus gentianae TaxID=43775 RepID=A0A1H7UZK8_9BACT|nr:MBL fold metallo-hydrolase [Syntrophus gentianae]SEM01937.1 Metallo-beta-lactamase superfamily protein [Syntrophus gentianae]
MSPIKHPPISLTANFYQLGTPAFPAFLSMGEIGMLIEGGTGPTFPIIVEQIRTLGISPEKIKYIILTHSHADHIGGIPHFKRIWPHIKLIGSKVADKIFKKKELFFDYLLADTAIAQLMKAKDEINDLPPALNDYHFELDSSVKEGDSIDLGKGIIWDVYETPGHSPCHICLFERMEGTLVVGDCTGFYVPEKDAFWPNYFVSLEDYVNSIRKLATLPANRAVLSHNCIVYGKVREYLQYALSATEKYHREIIERLANGETVEKIALDKARFVDSITDIQPFKIMYDLSKLMINRSQKADPNISFEL